MERIVVTNPVHGICYMQVCAEFDVTDEEILTVCNRENPSGTTRGWTKVVRNDAEYPQMNPVTCLAHPDRTHFMVSC